jgi:arylsulfatase
VTSLLSVAALAGGCMEETQRGRESAGCAAQVVLLISIDTLRADALGVYGSARRTTPRLDAWSAECTLFESVTSPSPWTIPSHASLLTSLDPGVTGADFHNPIPEELPLLAELFRGGGYATGAIVNTGYLGKEHGFAQGFDEFQHHLGRRDGPESIDIALDFLDRHRGQPAFFFLHLFDVHGPFSQPPPYGTMYLDEDHAPDAEILFLSQVGNLDYLEHLKGSPSVRSMRARYDGGVTRIDAEVGRLLDALEKRGFLECGLVVVTSDHGEAFFERGVFIGHGLFLYETELSVPLLIHFPESLGVGPGRVSSRVSTLDVAPTLLEASGLPIPGWMQGTSLLSAARRAGRGEGEVDPPARPIFGRSTNTGQTRFVRTGGWKFIEPLRWDPAKVVDLHLRPKADDVREELLARIEDGPRLYDLSNDPDERNNLAGANPELVREMERRLGEREEANRRLRERLVTRTREKIELDEETEAELRALGYLPLKPERSGREVDSRQPDR